MLYPRGRERIDRTATELSKPQTGTALPGPRRLVSTRHRFFETQVGIRVTREIVRGADVRRERPSGKREENKFATSNGKELLEDTFGPL